MSRNQQQDQKGSVAQQKSSALGQSQSASNTFNSQSQQQNGLKYQSKTAPRIAPGSKNRLTVQTAATKQVSNNRAAASNVSLVPGAVPQSAQVQFQAKVKPGGATIPGVRSLSQHGGGPNYIPATQGNTGGERLEVTVIPVDEEPYSKIVQIPHSLIGSSQHSQAASGNATSTFGAAGAIGGAAAQTAANTSNQYPSLKDIFQTSDTLWKNIFGSFVQANKQPLFSVFRKKIERKANAIISSIPANSTSELGLHILFLKCDGTKFPRNAYANSLEVYCSTYFYGPLVIVFGDTNPPYRLHDFPPYYLQEKIDPLNEEEQKFYPLPFSAKKDSLVRALMNERRFTIDLDELERILSLEEFMLYCYKTSFCPLINQKHEWSECNYAHRQQDFRRPPYVFFYMPEKCPAISEDGNWDSCEYYLDCQYSHTLVETLFNPLHYKLKDCKDRTPSDKFSCVKLGDLCCHSHSQEERDLAQKALRNVPRKLPYAIEEIVTTMRDYVDYLPDYIEVPQAVVKKASSDSSSPEIISPAENSSKPTKEQILPGKVGDFSVLGTTTQSSLLPPLQVSNAAKLSIQGPADLNAASNRQWQKLQDMFQEAQIPASSQSSVSSFKTSPLSVTVKPTKTEPPKEVSMPPVSTPPTLVKKASTVTSPSPLPTSQPKQITTSQIKPASQPVFVFELPNEKKHPESILEKIGTSPTLAEEAGLGASKAISAPGEKKRGKLKKAVKNIKGMQYVMTTVAPSQTTQSPESRTSARITNQTEDADEEDQSDDEPMSPTTPVDKLKTTTTAQSPPQQSRREQMSKREQSSTKPIQKARQDEPLKTQAEVNRSDLKRENDLNQNTKARATSEQQYQQQTTKQKATAATKTPAPPTQARQPVHHQQQQPEQTKTQSKSDENSKLKTIIQEKEVSATTPPRIFFAQVNEPSTATTTTRQTSSKASTQSTQQIGTGSRSPEPVEQLMNNKSKQEVGRLKAQTGQLSSSRSSSQLQSTKKIDKKGAQKTPTPIQNSTNSNQKSIHSVESPKSESKPNKPPKIIAKKTLLTEKQLEQAGISSPQTAIMDPSPTLSNSKSEAYESLQEQELRTLMMFGVHQKVKNEAGIALVDSHLNAQIQKDKLHMRLASRFAPEQTDKVSDDESSGSEGHPPLGSPDELSSPDSNIITIESVESPQTRSADLRKSDNSKLNKSAPFTYKKLPPNMVGEIDSDFDPTKLVYVTPTVTQTEEQSKQLKKQPANYMDFKESAAPNNNPSSTTTWQNSKQAPVKRSEQKKNQQKIASKPQRQFAQKKHGNGLAMPTDVPYQAETAGPLKTAAQVTPFVPKQHNNQQQQQQIRQTQGSSSYSLTPSPFKVHYSGQDPYKQQQQQEQNQNTVVVSSHNFAFGLPPSSPKTPPSVATRTTSTASASVPADQLMLERSSLAATPHNRQRGSGAHRAASPTEPFNCALFPTLQQIVTVMPEDEDESEEESQREQGSLLLGTNHVRTPAFGTGNAFSGRVGVGQLQWSFGNIEVPASVKELWEIDDAGQEDHLGSPSTLETVFASTSEMYSPQLRDKDPSRFASQSHAQSPNFSQQTSPEGVIQNIAANPLNEFDFINPYAFGQDKVE